MSYLLTEIALDMMGYKFYDIHGTFQATDFHNLSNSATNREEESLQDIIFQSQNRSLQRSASKSNLTNNEAQLPNISNFIEQIDPRENGDNGVKPATANQNASPAGYKKKPLVTPSTLKQFVEKEVNTIRDEISSNRTKFEQNDTHEFNTKENIYESSSAERLKSYKDREKQNLIREVRVLQNFASLVEKRLEVIDPEKFEETKQICVDDYI